MLDFIKTYLLHVWDIIISTKTERLMSGFILMLAGYFLANAIRNLLLKTVWQRLNAHQKLIWGRGLFYLIFGLFIVSGLNTMGLNLGVFLGAAGVLTVAIGFASQTSASNLISGLFIIGEGSFAVGDLIELMFIRGQVIQGEVISIDLMSVKLRTLDNIFIRLPNEQLIKTPILNLTRYPVRRIPIILSINFREDLTKVRRVLLKLAQDYPLALDEPKPIVTLQSFEESTIKVLFAVWTRREHHLRVRDELLEIVRNGFLEHHIDIPFPHMTISHAPVETLQSDVEQ